MKKQEFAKRLSELRKNKGVSAREMSLSLGQSENYINHIENAKAFPSMAIFLEICEYFGITPDEFFSYEKKNIDTISQLAQTCDRLTKEQIQLLVSVAENMKKVNS